MGLVAIAVALGILVVPVSGAAQTPLPGPDLPGHSAPSLQRADATASALSRDRLQRKLRKLARKAPGASGFYVEEIGAKGKAGIFGSKEGKRCRLASNTKLFTTATALGRLGGTSRIDTVVRRRGKLEKGKLRGNLYRVGGGDPSFGASGVRLLARQVAHSGIRRVAGDLIADDTIFDRLRGVPDSGYGPSEYVAPLSGLVYGGSTYDGDPAKEAAKAFEKKLRKRGVRVKGKIRVDGTPKSAAADKPIATFGSPSIASLIEETNHNSNNFYAEMLLKRIWATPKRQGTTKGGTRAVETFARQHGSEIEAKDGSGLTANNLSSPRDVVNLLVAMRKERDAEAYYDSLPRPGEGTLEDRMTGTSAAKRCRAKTGTITGVSALSGYCDLGKRTVAFSLLMNGVSDLESAHRIQDEMTVAISKYKP